MAGPRRRFTWVHALTVTLAVAIAAAVVFRPAPAPRPAKTPSPPAAGAAPSIIEAPAEDAEAAPAAAGFATVTPGARLVFPRDHGAHPAFRTEWWYVTGWLDTRDGPLGFQVTFFRTRPGLEEDNPSAFAAKQVLFAHAAVSDPKIGRLLHDQRIARQGFGLAEAKTGDADVVLDDWSLKRAPDGRFHTIVKGADFDLDLTLTPTQPLMLEGQDGYSQKGPEPSQASYYYSLPQLAVSGEVRRKGRAQAATGRAWMDREWSSTLLDPKAVGWDWTGLNFDDGSALMAFQVRDASGHALWAAGTLRDAGGAVTRFGPGDVRFSVVRSWRSPGTGALYPVARTLEMGGARRLTLTPLFDDQELDGRATGGPVYWEGAVTTEGGRGYLELTGYVSPLKM
ncbi:lipocalin-like domain-containing protein [Phenylobacterium sp.]|uniref:lipocalin-like domain-containing protein n=1 Tax=Phenylobacterium sp. TaxID=1871053 RepID=UPI0035B1A287